MEMKTIIQHYVYVYGDKEWRLDDPDDQNDKIKLLNIELGIIGDVDSGYHLCMTAEGCNTYDLWFETVDNAVAAALEDYNVPADGWKTIE